MNLFKWRIENPQLHLVLFAELLASAARVAVFQHVAELIEANHPFKDKGHNVRVLNNGKLWLVWFFHFPPEKIMGDLRSIW